MKKMNIALILMLVVIILTIFITNIIFNENIDKYQKKSYECCEWAINTNNIEWSQISPSAPCSCADTYNILQKTLTVLGIISNN